MMSSTTANFARELGELLTHYNLIPVEVDEGVTADRVSFVSADKAGWDDLVTLEVTSDPNTGVVTVSPR